MTDDNSSESAAPSTLDAIIKLFLSLILPSLYVGGLALVFKLFQRWNTLRLLSSSRKHKDNPYFGRHYARDMYLELSEQHSPETDEGRKILATALMKRAVQDVRRIMKIREEKGPLAALVRSGSVGEELLANIEVAEEDLNQECDEVAVEADMIRKNWSKTIFQEATQFANRELQIEKQQIQKQEEEVYAPDTELDQQRRDEIAEELLREEAAEKAAGVAKSAPKKRPAKKKSK